MVLKMVIFNYLNNRKQKIKINSSTTRFFSGVLFNFKIFLKDISDFCPTEIACYADVNTPYATGDCLKKLCNKKKKPQTFYL